MSVCDDGGGGEGNLSSKAGGSLITETEEEEYGSLKLLLLSAELVVVVSERRSKMKRINTSWEGGSTIVDLIAREREREIIRVFLKEIEEGKRERGLSVC